MRSAKLPWSRWQRLLYLAIPPVIAAWAWWSSEHFFVYASIAILALYSLIVGVKIVAVLAGLLRRNTIVIGKDELAALDEAGLPTYTVLVPLYKEAEVVPALIEGLQRLDYPKDRLDVKILLEEDDAETADCLEGMSLPAWIEVVNVPEGSPKTKPRACNVGLAQARGEFLVIFDAEDQPEPDQLKKAVIAFRRADERVVCLQAKLNFFNRGRNLITRWFTLEYATWFDLYLPGLHALGAPIPLGGTSNHFRTEVLRQVDGWDAYNVTEDCDLGVRLELGGWHTNILDSTTWEEAPSRLGVWLRQRSRWMKGYWQTHLVHTRRPLAVLSTLGPWKTLLMLVTVGGQVASLLVNPICWAIGIAWLFAQWPLFDPRAPWTVALVVATLALLGSNGLFVIIHMLAAMKRGFWSLTLFALFLPVYWLMLSIGAWRGFLQFFSAPFLWEKTPHGFEKIASGETRRLRAAQIKHGWTTGLIVASMCVVIVMAAIRAPRWLHYRERIALANIDLTKATLADEKKIEASWVGKQTLRLACDLPKLPPAEVDAPVVRGVVNLKVLDGEWYQVEIKPQLLDHSPLAIEVALDGSWQAMGTERPWNPDCLRRVRAVGIQLFGPVGDLKALTVAKVDLVDPPTVEPLRCDFSKAPERGEAAAMLQADFALNRAYDNPFDPERIDIWGEFSTPDGQVVRVPAFFTQEYLRTKEKNAEVLTATGAPHWSVRYSPPQEGPYSYRIVGKDHRGETFASERKQLAIAASRRHGYLRADPSQKYFSFADGTFYYPIGLNIRSPVDDRNDKIGKFRVPDAALGSYVMDDFLDQMAIARMNFGRVWMSPWYGGLEWRSDTPGFHGLGQYNLQNAWRLDRLMSYASEKGIMIEFALNSHGPFTAGYDSQWQDNPYNRRNGGPAVEPRDVLVAEKAHKIMKQRFRYIAARWGADPNLFAWTTWIEVNMVGRADGRTPPTIPEMVTWHRDLCDYLHEIDPGKHPISTEFNNEYGFKEVWDVPHVDYTQTSAYSGQMGLVSTIRDCARGMGQFGKPVVLEEYGGHAQGGGTMKYLAHELHDGLWATWMVPVAGAPLPWWWNFIFAKGLQRFQARFAQFAAGEDLRQEEWRFQDGAVSGSAVYRALLRGGKKTAYIWVYDPSTTDIPVGRSYWEQSTYRAQLYGQRIGKFDSMAENPGTFTQPQSGCQVSLQNLQLEPGRYQCEVWDTWEEKPVEKSEVDLSASMNLSLPVFARDIAIKLKKKD